MQRLSRKWQPFLRADRLLAAWKRFLGMPCRILMKKEQLPYITVSFVFLADSLQKGGFLMDITMPALQVLLLAIMFLAILVEVKTGGTGAGIIFGLVAAGVFWGSQYVKGAADLFQIELFLGGILCIIVEMLLPTVGLLAGVGVAAMLYSLVMALGGNFAAVTVLILALVAAIGVFALVVNQLPASRLWKRFVLKDQSTSKRGYVSAVEEPHLVGERGKVLTELRPSGSALLAGHPVDVVSEGAFIPKGELVQVVAVQGSRVVVRRVEQSPKAPTKQQA
ncbi:nodulation efficiency protein D [Mitsuokella multacida DSM 20544]|uniref:Nodulation efficiency protein D n=2 Tax=Mitsuokella multacida TaxID=52226 RepID=C9KNP2_9FIRM|nr:nodulation efficiency protein D [Mitsuokella multacida DSM 20544]